MILIVDKNDIIVGTSNGNISINKLKQEGKTAFRIDDTEFTPEMIGCKLISYEEVEE